MCRSYVISLIERLQKSYFGHCHKTHIYIRPRQNKGLTLGRDVRVCSSDDCLTINAYRKCALLVSHFGGVRLSISDIFAGASLMEVKHSIVGNSLITNHPKYKPVGASGD